MAFLVVGTLCTVLVLVALGEAVKNARGVGVQRHPVTQQKQHNAVTQQVVPQHPQRELTPEEELSQRLADLQKKQFGMIVPPPVPAPYNYNTPNANSVLTVKTVTTSRPIIRSRSAPPSKQTKPTLVSVSTTTPDNKTADVIQFKKDDRKPENDGAE